MFKQCRHIFDSSDKSFIIRMMEEEEEEEEDRIKAENREDKGNGENEDITVRTIPSCAGHRG